MLAQKLSKITLSYLFVFTACCFCIKDLYAQSKQHDYIISQQLLGIEDGLAAREAYCGLQDGKGFIWFGTRNGLNRYDGKKFQLFTRHNLKMQESNVVKLASDMNDRLFILYGYSGYSRLAIGKVDVLDQNTLQIKSLSETFKNLPFKEADVYWIANDGTDRINIMTKSPYRLWEYSTKGGFNLRFEMKAWNTPKYGYSVPTGPFNFFYKDYACLGFNGHEKQYVIHSNMANEVVTQMKEGIYKPVSLYSNKELVLYHSDYDYNHVEFLVLDTTGKLVPNSLNKTAQLKNAAKDGTTVISVANDTTSILNVKNQGLFLYNNNLLLQLLDAASIKNYSNLIVNECFSDKLGNLWICSSGGIYKIKITKNKFTQYFTKDQQQMVGNNQARGILLDETGKLYSNIWNHLLMQKDGKMEAAISNDIKYALVHHAGKLYTTSYNLEELSTKENKFKLLKNANTGRDILSAYSLNDSILLLGKMEQIFAFNTNNNSITQIKSPTNGINLPYRFLKRKDGTIWVVGENGLYLLSSQGNILDYFNIHNKQAGHQLPIDNLTDVFEDEQGIIWLATNGDGLYKWNRINSSFKRFGIEDGMPSAILYRIEVDKKKNLWISTENGLACFNPSNEIINTFFERDGLSHNEFNRLSSYKSEDGRMFFGGLNGVNAFYPSDILSENNNAEAIPLRVISYHQFREEEEKLVDLTANLLQHNKVLLKPHDKFFILQFRLLDFENKVNHYAYKLEGVDKDWTYTTENTIRLSGLPHGKFTLLVKSQTANGQWSKQQLEIPVEVQVPLYKKWEAQLLLFFIIIACIVFFFRYRTSKLKKDKLLLEKAVNSRTTLLQKTLTERELLLKEIHHRVKNNLQIISSLLDLQKDEIDNEQAKAIFNEGQSRVKSIALIHQSLYQNNNLAEIKLASFVKELTSQVADVYEQASSKMQIEVNIPDLILDIDTIVPLALIINELLTNAFKYGGSKNTKEVISISLQPAIEGTYVLTFSDNGPGIKEGIDFDSASTLGLRLVKGLAGQLYGNAVYHYDNGSVFKITFKDTSTRKSES